MGHPPAGLPETDGDSRHVDVAELVQPRGHVCADASHMMREIETGGRPSAAALSWGLGHVEPRRGLQARAPSMRKIPTSYSAAVESVSADSVAAFSVATSLSKAGFAALRRLRSWVPTNSKMARTPASPRRGLANRNTRV